ncbi:cyclase [Actinobacillus succinogenes]|uniref:Cyclase family protein n=1 Tax=Actinobacillus succinogenes (strain ATCC 55618 / DSM 22257 / CCUG 43843 / 130Z) TaxID=339671 RepID=A6VKK0_ACTSZ|nr:cyclase family protein [Actinobacillus succinogenes]ABR73497.1 cyclase family protein [Actinobacillus succinogenes 130Z]PHI40039.1 cyclase [Actinobacillus succinogenes]
MFIYLSHKLDPNDLAWPGEPMVEVVRCTDVSEETPFSSFITKLPNHCGTHMDAPRHFVKEGLSINELAMEYFCHKDIALLDIPKGEAEGITREDLESYADILAKVSFAFLRTGFEKYRTENPLIYQNEGPYIAVTAGQYLSDNFPNLKGVGIDFLSIGSPSSRIPDTENPKNCHQAILGYHTGRFTTVIEDMHLAELPKGAKIKQFINAPLRITGLDSSQVTCIVELE